MIIYDKKEGKIEKSNSFDLGSIIERQNINIGAQYFESVDIYSLNDIKKLDKDGNLEDWILEEAISIFEEKMQNYIFADIKTFVIVEMEEEETKLIFKHFENDVQIEATEYANHIIDSYNGDIEIEVNVFENVKELILSECGDEVIADFVENEIRGV